MTNALIILGFMAYTGVGLGLFLGAYKTPEERIKAGSSFCILVMVIWPTLVVAAITKYLIDYLTRERN